MVALSTPENQQAVDGDNQRDRLSTGLLCSLFTLDLKEPGYKVAWIEKPVQRLLQFFLGGFRASRRLIQAML